MFSVTPIFFATVLCYTGHLLAFMSSVWKARLEPTLHGWSPLKHVTPNHPHDTLSAKVLSWFMSSMQCNRSTATCHWVARPTEVIDEFIPGVSMVMPMPGVWVATPCIVTAMAGLRSVDLEKRVRKLHPESTFWCLDDSSLLENWKHKLKNEKVTNIDGKISNPKNLSSTMTSF